MFRLTLCVAVLAVCGFVSVSAGFENLLKGADDGNVLIRQRRHLEACGPATFDAAGKCCTLPTVVPQTAIDTCIAAAPQRSGKQGGKGKSAPKQAPARGKRHAGGASGSAEGMGGKEGILECALTAQGLITAGKFDSAAYAAAFKALDTANAYSPLLDNTIAACQASADAAAAANPGRPACPSKMYLCIQKGLLQNCPGQLTDATCTASIAALAKCDPYAARMEGGKDGKGGDKPKAGAGGPGKKPGKGKQG